MAHPPATILAARKLNESGIKPWGIEVAISDAVSKAELILGKIDERWPAEKRARRGDELGALDTD